MKNTFKRIIAMLIAGTILLSVAACSKVSDGEQSAEGKEIVNAADGENVVSNENAEAIRAEIKQKAADIIATLEVGKTYDEMPITAKKLGVERFNSTPYSEGSSAQPQQVYVDLTRNQVCREPEYFNYYLPIWYMGENDEIKEMYYQIDKTVVPYDDVGEIDYRKLSELYCDTGYDMWAFDEDELPFFDFTYVGTEELEGFGETLVFEAIYGLDYNKYNVDPETGFWVRYYHNTGIEALYDGIGYEFLVKDIVIEPDYYVPDFENDIVYYSTYSGFSTLEEAEEEWFEALSNRDLDSIAAMIPQSQKIHEEFYSYGGATPTQWCSIASAEEASFVLFTSKEYFGITADKIKTVLYEEQISTDEAKATDENIEEAVYRLYLVEDTDEEIGIDVVFVNEKGRGWSAFALFNP